MLGAATMGGDRRVRARRHRLFWRTAAAILGLLSLAATLPAGVRHVTGTRRARARLVDQTRATASVAASAASELLAHESTPSLARLMASLVAHNPDVELAVVSDRAGAVVASSVRDAAGVERLDVAPPPPTAIVDEVVDATGRRALRAVAPIAF